MLASLPEGSVLPSALPLYLFSSNSFVQLVPGLDEPKICGWIAICKSPDPMSWRFGVLGGNKLAIFRITKETAEGASFRVRAV
jgi:hypothetical protein